MNMKSPGWTKGWERILDKERGYTEKEWEETEAKLAVFREALKYS